MAKALSNQEIARLRDNSGTEIEEIASSSSRAQKQGINTGPVTVPRGPQRILELKRRYAAVEGQSESEGAAEWKQAAEELQNEIGNQV